MRYKCLCESLGSQQSPAPPLQKGERLLPVSSVHYTQKEGPGREKAACAKNPRPHLKR